MSTRAPLLNASRAALLVVALAVSYGEASAQLQSNESQPGGVEALPKQPMAPGTMMRAPAPQAAPAPTVSAPAAAMTAAPKPTVPVDAKKAKDDGKADKGETKKSKKSFKKSTSPDGAMAPRAAPPPPAPGTAPAIPGDESRPGGVERVPTMPQPKQ